MNRRKSPEEVGKMEIFVWNIPDEVGMFQGELVQVILFVLIEIYQQMETSSYRLIGRESLSRFNFDANQSSVNSKTVE